MSRINKFIPLLIIAILILTFIAGCQSAQKKITLNDLAESEKQWLTELEPITKQIDNAYETWARGETDRSQFNASLEKIHNDYLKINQEYQKYMKKNKLSDADLAKPVYKEGLVNGKKLRANVNDFLVVAAEGVKNPKTKEMVPLNDSQVKYFYQQKMIVEYNKHFNGLKNALKTLEGNKDKTQ